MSWLTRELSAPPRCMAGIRAQVCVCVCAWIGRDRVDIGKDEKGMRRCRKVSSTCPFDAWGLVG